MAPSTTDIKSAAPNRSQKCLFTVPGNPERPSSSAPGDISGTVTPAGVRASVQTTNILALPACTVLRVSPNRVVPRSTSTTDPSALYVSAAVTQVTSPGSVESIAVISVASIVAPLGNNR